MANVNMPFIKDKFLKMLKLKNDGKYGRRTFWDFFFLIYLNPLIGSHRISLYILKTHEYGFDVFLSIAI